MRYIVKTSERGGIVICSARYGCGVHLGSAVQENAELVQ